MNGTADNYSQNETPIDPSIVAIINAEKISRIVVPIVITTLMIVGVIGNVLVIIVSITSQRIVQAPVCSALVISIAVADLIYLVFNAPYSVESNTSSPMEWPYPPAYCTVLHFFSITAVSASIFSMCILAWLRFMGTTYPFFFHGSLLSTKTFGYSTILGAWTCAVALAMPHTVFVREIIVNTTVNIEGKQCAWTNEAAERICFFVVLTFTYILPLVLVTFFYAQIYRTSKTARGTTPAGSRDGSESAMNVMIFGLVTAFLILWFPSHLEKFIIMSRPIERLSDMLMIILLNTTGLCTSYAHACINPIIYTFAAPPFRKHIFKDIKCFVSQAVKKLYCCPKTQDQAYALERISDPAGKSILNVQDGPSSTGVTSVHLCSNGNSRNFEETRS